MMRYALYFTPGRNHPLTFAAAAWLGRDAFTGEEMPLAAVEALSAADVLRWTAEPRRYGFHATLVAPFRLGPCLSEHDVLDAAKALAVRCVPFTIPCLTIARLGNFLALVPASLNADVDALANSAVDGFSPLRAPLTDGEIARRNPSRLSERQRAYLEQYGYPYVKEEFRFHMTLTGPVTDAEAARIEPRLKDLLAPHLASPLEVEAVALFVEPEPGAPFTVHSTHRFGQTEARKYA